MSHNISATLIERLSKGPSVTKTSQVANIQTHIQNIFSAGFHSFLQGSYKNDTAILDINDVDIMVIKLSTYSSRHSPFAPGNPLIYWETIFGEIEQKLKDQNLYKWTIKRGNKCITVTSTNFKADIVPAVQVGIDYKVDPVVIYSFRDGIEKINYPRTHYDNGVAKNARTDRNYKAMVRIFKNWAKNYFDNKNILSSYKIESLVYGIDDNKFSSNYPLSFVDIAIEIYKKLNQINPSILRIPSVCGYENILDNWDLRFKQAVADQLLISADLVMQAYKATDPSTANNLFKQAFNMQI
jgi:hypothetical protein